MSAQEEHKRTGASATIKLSIPAGSEVSPKTLEHQLNSVLSGLHMPPSHLHGFKLTNGSRQYTLSITGKTVEESLFAKSAVLSALEKKGLSGLVSDGHAKKGGH